MATKLTAVGVQKLTVPGRYSDSEVRGLMLQVRSATGKAWMVRVQINGKRHDIGLGTYPEVSLGAAREKARALRTQIADGVHPLEERERARAQQAASKASRKTFKEAAELYIASKAHEWSNPKHADQWANTLQKYAYPELGALRCDLINLGHIQAVLDPIWTVKPETASRLRGRIESVIGFATVKGWRHGDNPARWTGHLDKVYASTRKVKAVKHFEALPYGKMYNFMQALRAEGGIAARAVEFTILTAARSGMVRGAQWSEFDLEGKAWTVPADRMKARKEFRVALSEQAVLLIRAQPRIEGCPYVFPGMKHQPLSDMSLTAVLRRMTAADDAVWCDEGGDKITVHGFRSTFRDWAAETTNYPNELCEMALAHTVGDKAEAAYRRQDMFAKRVKLMQDWAEYVDRKPGAATITVLQGVKREA